MVHDIEPIGSGAELADAACSQPSINLVDFVHHVPAFPAPTILGIVLPVGPMPKGFNADVVSCGCGHGGQPLATVVRGVVSRHT